MRRTCVCMAILTALLTGCQQQERPETTAYRKAVENLRVENRQLQQQADVASKMLNVTTVALVITGCGLGVSLFVLRWTHRRR